MHPDIVIARMDRQPDDLSKRIDDLNTLNCQSSDANTAS